MEARDYQRKIFPYYFFYILLKFFMNKTVAIFVNSEQKGFLTSLAQVLEDEYCFSTRLILRDHEVKKTVDKILPNRSNDIVLSDIECLIDDVISESRYLEEKYKCRLSMLISENRALGQGYLFNVEKIPDIIRASWSHEDKLREFIEIIKKHEIALNGCDFVIRQWPDKVTSMICREQNICTYSFVKIKFGSRMFWSDNDYVTSSNLIKRIKNKSLTNHSGKSLDYVIESHGDKVNKSVNYTFSNALKSAIRLIWNDNKKWLRGMQKKDSYHYLGWLPSIFRQALNYKYIKSISVQPNQVSTYKLCFFPLHLEPEVALLNFSPEFNNSMEAITWISKSLPADTLLVVKEQALSFGVRSNWYYRQINKIGNVVWADPDVHSWDWINQAEIITTITGTVGVEAVHMKKPVVSFGAHQIINYLPTVRYVESYKQTKLAIDEFLHGVIDEESFESARSYLSDSQFESSIELPEYESLYLSNNLETELAKRALKNLFSEYPVLLK